MLIKTDGNPIESSAPALIPSTAVANAVRQSIDEQIHALKIARNRTAPISRLSPELLSCIFELANGIKSSDSLTWSRFNNIAHVCRAWRSIAFSCPNLWSRLSFSDDADSKRVLEEMLTNSTTSPHIIRIPGMFKSWANLSPSLLTQLLNLERIQELHLDLQERELSRILDVISGAQARSLRCMVIRNTSNPDLMSPSPFLAIPSRIFSIPMPRLRHLSITNCRIPWKSIPLYGIPRELVSLKLSNVTPPPKTLFYDLLSLNPDLKILDLDSALPSSSDAEPGRIRVITLPKLTSCTFKSSIAQYVDFRMHIASICHATIHFSSLSSDPRSPKSPPIDIKAISTLLSSCDLSTDNPFRRRHDSILLENAGKTQILKVTLWNLDSTPDPISTTPLLPTDDPTAVVIDLAGAALHPPPPLLDLLSIPGLQNIFIDVGLEAPHAMVMHGIVARDGWLDFFGRHPEVKQLHVRAGSAMSIFCALSTSLVCPAGSQDPEAFRPYLPNLETLTLDGHGNGLSGEVDAAMEGSYVKEFDQLLDALVKRHGRGLTVKKLTLIECCGLNEGAVRRLEKVVGAVNWDGVILPVRE